MYSLQCMPACIEMLLMFLSATIRLGRKVSGRVKIGNLTDKYVEDFKSLYHIGELVTAKVIRYGET